MQKRKNMTKRKRLVAMVAACCLVGTLFQTGWSERVCAAADADAGGTVDNVQLKSQLGLLITGDKVEGTVGFSEDIIRLTPEELEELKTNKNPQTYGLGNSWKENQRFSSYDNHGKGTYHYSIVSGLDIETLLEAVTSGGFAAVESYWIWSADTYATKQEPRLTKDLKYFAPGDTTGVSAPKPMIACYKATNESAEPANGVVPSESDMQRLPAGEDVFVYGQNAITDDNNCHFIKKVNALYVGDPQTWLRTDQDAYTLKRLKDLMELGIYQARYSWNQDGEEKTAQLEGVPLKAVLEDMKLDAYLAASSQNQVQGISEDGSSLQLSYKDLEGAFVAWDCDSQDAIPDGQSGQLALYTAKGVVSNLIKLNVVDAQGELATQTPETGTSSLAAPASFRAAKVGYDSVRLAWKSQSDADGYIIQRYDKKTKAWKQLKTLSAGSTSYRDKGLTLNATYRYRIQAYAVVEGQSYGGSFSAAVSAKPALGKTKIKKISKSGKKGTTLKWKKVAGATGYQVYRSGKKNSGYKKIATVKKGSKVSYADKKWKTGKSCYYKVRPYRLVNGKAKYGTFSAAKKVKRRSA